MEEEKDMSEEMEMEGDTKIPKSSCMTGKSYYCNPTPHFQQMHCPTQSPYTYHMSHMHQQHMYDMYGQQQKGMACCCPVLMNAQCPYMYGGYMGGM